MQTADTLSVRIPMGRGNNRITALLAIVALSDFLIFRRTLGLNLFLIAISVTAAVLFFAARRLARRTAALLFAFAALASAPLLEAPSPMAVILSLGAIMFVALASVGLVPRRLTDLPLVLFRFGLAVPLQFFRDCWKRLASPTRRSPIADSLRKLSVWIAPLVLASIFLFLFALANPLIEETLRSINLAFLLQFMDIWRIGFWLLVAALVWPMLRPRLRRRGSRRTLEEAPQDGEENVLLSHPSLLRSLLVFNALFAVESLLDLAYLWGGMDLPNGMSHAEYAHRGAYPLIATALLAAAFVLVTMRRNGPGDKSALLRGLVHVWIAQNILLCLSSLLRLDLYVETFSLTELRVAAGIWMGLVAIGLALILLRIALRLSNEWLVAMNFAALAIVLYASAVIDFPAVIAHFNVMHSQEVSRDGVPLDLQYLASLGPSAIPALDLYLAGPSDAPIGKMLEAQRIRDSLAYDVLYGPSDWRGWTYRAARIKGYLRSPATIAR